MDVGIIYSRPELERIPVGVLEGVKDCAIHVYQNSFFKPLKFAKTAEVYLAFAQKLWKLVADFEDKDPHFVVKLKLFTPDSVLLQVIEYTVDKERVNIEMIPTAFVSKLYDKMESVETLYSSSEGS